MDFDGEDLARDRGPDVGTHDDADGLRQGHEPRIDEADRHDRGGTAALQYSSYQCTCDHTHDPVFCQKCKNRLHFLSGCLLKTFTHQIHAIDEYSKSTQQSKYNLHIFFHLSSFPIIFLCKTIYSCALCSPVTEYSTHSAIFTT